MGGNVESDCGAHGGDDGHDDHDDHDVHDGDDDEKAFLIFKINENKFE